MVMDRYIAELRSIVGEGNILVDEPMRNHTTFKVGGPADCIVVPTTVGQLVDVVSLCRANGIVVRVMGKGSNVLVSDDGVRGVVVQISTNLGDVRVLDGNVISAQAGASNAKVAATALRASLAGYEFAAGIPGTIGGASIMNAGAYGGEFKQVATRVTCISQAGDLVDVNAEEADWGYRSSMMQKSGMVVVSASLQLAPGDPEEIRARMEDLAKRRQDKQPLDMPSAGSTFKRPEGHYAGKLIQDAGLMGYTVGGAQVSTKHAGFVVNAGGATAADIKQLIADVQAIVEDKFGVSLEPEVRLWGFED